MKASELKLRIQTSAENLIDVYFNDNTIVDKLANSTMKVLLRNNIYKVDDVLKLFTDKEGEIDAKSIIDTYANTFGEGIPFDIKGYIKSDFVRNLLPNKTLIITKEDILKIIEDNNNIQCGTTSITYGQQ